MSLLTKITQFRVLVCLCLILSIGVFSCSSDLEEKLIGTWQGSDFLFHKTEGPDVVLTINGGLEQHLRSKLIFAEDGTYQKLVGEYANGNGVWLVDKDLLFTKGENDFEQVYKLVQVTDTKLVTRHEVTLETPDGDLIGEIILTYSR